MHVVVLIIHEAVLVNDCSSASTRQLAADMNHPFTKSCIKDDGKNAEHHMGPSFSSHLEVINVILFGI